LRRCLGTKAIDADYDYKQAGGMLTCSPVASSTKTTAEIMARAHSNLEDFAQGFSRRVNFPRRAKGVYRLA